MDQTYVRTHVVRVTTEVENGEDTAGLAYFIETGDDLPLGKRITQAEDMATWKEGDKPYTHHGMYEGLSEQMWRMMLNRGVPPTVGLRFLCMDLANLALTGEGQFANDTEPKDASLEDFGDTRDALKRILDAFYSRSGKNNTHLLDAMEHADSLLEGSP